MLKGVEALNTLIQSLIKEVVQIEVSGKKILKGTLIDVGTDIMVIFNGTDYMYIPVDHIQNFYVLKNNELDPFVPEESFSDNTGGSIDGLSLRVTLQQAKGKNTEIYLIDDQPLNGYITQILEDYFEFYSPIYKTMYISTKHLKWLIPNVSNEGPYGLDLNYTERFVNRKLENTFNNQIEKFKDKLIVFNIGGSKSHIGIIENVEEQVVELKKARTDKDYLNINHIKTFHEV